MHKLFSNYLIFLFEKEKIENYFQNYIKLKAYVSNY